MLKVLGATIFLRGAAADVLQSFGYVGHHSQFRIICKCKSMADANRKCAAVGLGDRVFISGDCATTGNETELSVCENTDIAIGVEGVTSKTYISIEQYSERLKTLTNNNR